MKRRAADQGAVNSGLLNKLRRVFGEREFHRADLDDFIRARIETGSFAIESDKIRDEGRGSRVEGQENLKLKM